MPLSYQQLVMEWVLLLTTGKSDNDLLIIPVHYPLAIFTSLPKSKSHQGEVKVGFIITQTMGLHGDIDTIDIQTSLSHLFSACSGEHHSMLRVAISSSLSS